MKLRYLHLQGVPPLEDASITFQQSSVLSNPLAVHFVAGVNGTGKTSLLQTITETLLSLARERAALPFPMTLAYDLGNGNRRTILLIVPPAQDGEITLVEFEDVLPPDADWRTLTRLNWKTGFERSTYSVRNHYTGGDLPGAGSIEAYIPSTLIVYTSGSILSWQQLFFDEAISTLINVEIPESSEETIERPLKWDVWKEYDHLRRTVDPKTPVPQLAPELDITYNTLRYGVLMSSEQIKLALCAVTLYQVIHHWAQAEEQESDKYPDKGFGNLLKEVDWIAPTALNLTINFQPERLTTDQSAQLYDLIQLANRVRREPEPGTRRLLSFDIQTAIPSNLHFRNENIVTTGQIVHALYEILGGGQSTPYKVFKTLYDWQQTGLLTDLTLAIQKDKVEDLILYDWLSDGERMFLGRFSLIYLLQDDDDAFIIFGEPETHFNDVWKRRLMEIVYRSLGQRASEVLISTHSSIVLTDVPSSQIILLVKGESGVTEVIDLRNPTFGADPSDIMINVLDTGYAGGVYSSDLINKALERANPEELVRLLEEVSPGYWRFRIRDLLNQLNDPSH